MPPGSESTLRLTDTTNFLTSPFQKTPKHRYRLARSLRTTLAIPALFAFDVVATAGDASLEYGVLLEPICTPPRTGLIITGKLPR